MMALYTYDEDADALYVLFAAEEDAVIARTDEITDRVHADRDRSGALVGIEILYPRRGLELGAIHEQLGINLRVPFTFAA